MTRRIAKRRFRWSHWVINLLLLVIMGLAVAGILSGKEVARLESGTSRGDLPVPGVWALTCIREPEAGRPGVTPVLELSWEWEGRS